MKKHLSFKELAEETKVPERTVRYYIARGILEPPLKRGPKATYSEKHKETLMKIKELQEQGLTLSEIARFFVSIAPHEKPEIEDLQSNIEPVTKLLPSETQIKESVEFFEKTSTWHAYEIGEDFIVLVKSGVKPWRIKNIISALKNIWRR